MFVQVRDVYKSFNNVDCLKGISLNLIEKEQYVISGASGSGKSTLLYLMGGLDQPTDGEVLVQDHKLTDYNDEMLAKYRNEFVGFVFQFHFLLPSMNCWNNILLPARLGGRKKDKIKQEVRLLAKELGVEDCLEKFPYQLSGGEQQRINIIRALSLHPKLLLCDEPTGNLDSKNTDKVTSLLRDLAVEYQSTLVIVTHDGNVASKFSNKFHIQDGNIVG